MAYHSSPLSGRGDRAAGSGLPTERHRKVRISAFAHTRSGLKVVLEVPVVIASLTAQDTASEHQLGTSWNGWAGTSGLGTSGVCVPDSG